MLKNSIIYRCKKSGVNSHNQTTYDVVEVAQIESPGVALWLLERIQDGEDNGAKYEMTTEQLDELREECEKSLSLVNSETKDYNPSFIGFPIPWNLYTTTLDYVKQLERTIDVLNKEKEHYGSGATWSVTVY